MATIPFKDSEACAPSRRRLVQALAGLSVVSTFGIVACSQSEPKIPSRSDRFPSFSLPALDGTVHSSSSYAGRPLLLNFWATWCPPCRSEMNDLETLHRKLAPKDLVLLAISVDLDVNLVREFVRKERLSFTVLIDPGQRWAAGALKVPGFPTSYVVGRDSLIRDVMVGPRAWATEDVQRALAAQLELQQ